MGSEFLEIFIYLFELAYPVGKVILYLGSIDVETESEQSVADQKGPPRSQETWLGYRRARKRYAHRFVAIAIGIAVYVPAVVLIIWWMLRLASSMTPSRS